MRLDRRDFIRLGAAGILLGPRAASDARLSGSAAAASGQGPTSKLLKVHFSGLYVIEQRQHAVTIHLVDGKKLKVPMPHIPQIKANKSAIYSTTKKADHASPAGGTDEEWLWDAQGKELAIVEATGGTPDLQVDESSPEDSLETPATDAGWSSLARVPDLKVAFGGTGLSPNASSYYVTSISLDHGHFGATVPGDNVNTYGAFCVWRFEDPRQGRKLLFQRALTDRVLYTYPTNNKLVTLKIGGDRIVFKSDVDADVTISNEPPPIKCGRGCRPDMLDFHAYRKLMAGSQFDPAITLYAYNPPEGENAGSNYCPGGRG